MTRNTVSYRFETQVDMIEVEASLLLALWGTESLHGASRVRLDASYRFDADQRLCEIDDTTEVGQTLARLLVGFLSREFGEGAFRIERMNKLVQPEAARNGHPAAAHPAHA